METAAHDQSSKISNRPSCADDFYASDACAVHETLIKTVGRTRKVAMHIDLVGLNPAALIKSQFVNYTRANHACALNDLINLVKKCMQIAALLLNLVMPPERLYMSTYAYDR